MIVRIRLGSNLARLAPAPMLRLELPDDATVEDLYDRLASSAPELGPALASALPVVDGAARRSGPDALSGSRRSRC